MNAEECRCCKVVSACTDAMEKSGLDEIRCITEHPGYENGCLDPWVLKIAAVGLKTKSKRSYIELFDNGKRTETEYVCQFQYEDTFNGFLFIQYDYEL